jgi:hypothetical protein
VETRVYFDAASGEAVHVHRLAVAPDQEVDDDLRRGADAFDKWLRSRYLDRELDFVEVEESDLQGEGPISVDITSRTLVRRE